MTTLPISFYNKYICHHPVKPLNDLLHVIGAAGQVVPYVGYVEVDVKFPKEFLGSGFTVPTLALVVPDVSFSPLLIGMNTLEPLYEKYVQSN